MPGKCLPPGTVNGPWLIPSFCHCTEPHRGIRAGAHNNSSSPWSSLPVSRRIPQQPCPLNTPRRFEHNSSSVLTFSTSSLQSCRGHRATGEEISVGGVVRHSALTPTGKDAPWTQQGNSRDKPALHPAAAARSMPLPLIPAPSSSVSQWESKSLPELLQPLHSMDSRKKKDQLQSPLHSKAHFAVAAETGVGGQPFF